MKKYTTSVICIFAILLFALPVSAQIGISFTATQTADNAIELTWTALGGVEEGWEFKIDRYDQFWNWANIATVPSEGPSVENYTYTDFGPFVNGTSYAYYLSLLDDQGQFIDSVFAEVTLLENPYFFNGKIGFDDDVNCTLDPGEATLYGKLVEATNGTEVYYGSSNFNGEYNLVVPGNETYTISLLYDHPYWETCVDPVTVVATSPGSSTIDFPLEGIVDCPYLIVDVETVGLRRCMTNNLYVTYFNDGTVAAENAYIEVELDPFLTAVNSTPPWTSVTGNTYTYELGSLEVGEFGSIWIEADLDCEVELGQTHCTTAHIFPDSLCVEPSVSWDGSSIQVTGACVNDDVQFTIRNNGELDMTEELEYIVIQDNVMLSIGGFQLNAGQEIVKNFVADGSTYRLEAQQAEGHPGFSMPSIAVEGCGGITPGFVTLFGEDDEDPFISISCRENVDSYDPNDKQGFPVGYGEPHYIHTGQDLEYLIRFQNTGTAPAINIYILDTLDKNLDLSTIQPGASTHPYRYEYFGNGAIQFAFENINLPDSTTNEPDSHGFVKFHIKQNPALPLETEVFNRAAIYFDFNPPVLTNTTMHTVGEEFIAVRIDDPKPGFVQTKIYPNPFTDVATFEIDHSPTDQSAFKLYNQLGQLVKEKSFTGHQFRFERGLLPTGLYLFEITAKGQLISSGKIVVK